jgi:outer membrane protein OmpA-like peptidoglycan-associated protein
MRKSYITLLSFICGAQVVSAPLPAFAYDYISHSGVSSVDVDTSILSDEPPAQPEQDASAEPGEEAAPVFLPSRAAASPSADTMSALPVAPVEPAQLGQKLSKPFFTNTTLDAPEQPVAEPPAHFPAELIKPHASAAPETPVYRHKSAATAPAQPTPIKPIEVQQVAPPKSANPETVEITPDESAALAAPATAAAPKSNAITWFESPPTTLAPVAAAPVVAAPVVAAPVAVAPVATPVAAIPAAAPVTPAPAAVAPVAAPVVAAAPAAPPATKELSPAARFIESLPATQRRAAPVAAAPVAPKPVETATAPAAPVAPVVKKAPAAAMVAVSVPAIPAPVAPKTVEAKVLPSAPVAPVKAAVIAPQPVAQKPVAEIVDIPPPDEPLKPATAAPVAPQPVAAAPAAVEPKKAEITPPAPKTVVATAPVAPAKPAAEKITEKQPAPVAPVKPTLAAEKAAVVKPVAPKAVEEAENIDAEPALPVAPVEAKPIDTVVPAAKAKTETALVTPSVTTSLAPDEIKATAPKKEDNAAQATAVKTDDKAKVEAPQAPAQTAAAPAPEKPADKAADKTPAVPSLSDLSLDFDTTSSTLTPSAEKKLDALASQLQGIDDIRLQIRGFAKGDGDGQSSARRMALSRVLVVRSYLMDKGIKPIRLDVQALGTETDKAPIDRVDLVFVR